MPSLVSKVSYLMDCKRAVNCSSMVRGKDAVDTTIVGQEV